MDNFKKIYLGNGLFSLVDACVYEELNKHTWWINKGNYATTKIGYSTVLMHNPSRIKTKKRLMLVIIDSNVVETEHIYKISKTQEKRYCFFDTITIEFIFVIGFLNKKDLTITKKLKYEPNIVEESPDDFFEKGRVSFATSRDKLIYLWNKNKCLIPKIEI